MYTPVTLPFGKSGYDTGTTYAPLAGSRGLGKDEDTIAGALTTYSQSGRELVLVHNNTGTTIAAGVALKFDSSGTFGVDVILATSGSRIHGFAPPVIKGATTNTIPAGAYFWMVKEGGTSVLKSTANVAINDGIEAGAVAGQVKSNSGTGYSQVLAGEFIAADTGGTSKLTRAHVNCQW